MPDLNNNTQPPSTRPCSVFGEDCNGSRKTPLNRIGGVSTVVGSGLGLCILLVIAGVQPMHMLEPTVAGIVWAVLFLVGYVLGGIGRGQLRYACICVLGFLLATLGFVELSDFGFRDSLVLSTSVAAVGFVSGRLTNRNWSWMRELKLKREANLHTAEPRPRDAPSTFSIWDLGFASVVVAVASNSFGKIEAPYALAACVFFAAIGGIVCSIVAARLALHDRWDIRYSGMLLAIPLAISAALYLLWPIRFDVTLAWLITGPVNAIAAQATTVLLCCAAYRWDSNRVWDQNRQSTQAAC